MLKPKKINFSQILFDVQRFKRQSKNIEDFSIDALISIAKAIEVQRVSIWLTDSKQDAINCKLMIDRDKGPIIEITKLFELDFPQYFKALKLAQPIVADDAQNDLRTKEFKDSYLVPFKITSMLDLPVISNSELKGIICCEHCGDKRHWSEREQRLVSDIAGLFSEFF